MITLTRREALRWSVGWAGLITLGAATGSAARAQSFQQRASQTGRTLVFGDRASIRTADPHTGETLYLPPLYVESLTSSTLSGELKPLLATSMDVSPDVRVYTFGIRPGVQFHNGRAMTVEDVAWSLQRIKDPKTKAWQGDDLKDVTIEVLDKNTLRVTSAAPNAALPASLAQCFVVARECVQTDGTIAHPIGTGPFMFVSWTPGQDLNLTRFSNYWGAPLPHLDGIRIIDMSDPTARLDAIRSGTVALTSDLAPTDMPLLASNSNVVTQQTSTNATTRLTFNARNPVPPLGDVRVRRAILSVIDKQSLAIAQLGDGGPGQANYQFFDANAYWSLNVPDIFATPNVDAARSLLADAGVSGGFDTTCLIVPGYRTVAEVVQQQVAAIGVNMSIDIAPDQGTFEKRLQDYQYGLQIDGYLTRDDPHLMLKYMQSTNPFVFYLGGYSNPKVDALIDAALSTADANSRRQMYSEVLTTISNEDVNTVILITQKNVWASSPNLQGFVVADGRLHRVDGGLSAASLAA